MNQSMNCGNLIALSRVDQWLDSIPIAPVGTDTVRRLTPPFYLPRCTRTMHCKYRLHLDGLRRHCSSSQHATDASAPGRSALRCTGQRHSRARAAAVHI